MKGGNRMEGKDCIPASTGLMLISPLFILVSSVRPRAVRVVGTAVGATSRPSRPHLGYHPPPTTVYDNDGCLVGPM